MHTFDVHFYYTDDESDSELAAWLTVEVDEEENQVTVELHKHHDVVTSFVDLIVAARGVEEQLQRALLAKQMLRDGSMFWKVPGYESERIKPDYRSERSRSAGDDPVPF